MMKYLVSQHRKNVVIHRNPYKSNEVITNDPDLPKMLPH